MYSGITRGLFPVVEVSREPGLLRYVVDLGAELSAGLTLGASVAIDGVCQTVVALEGSRVHFDAIQETLDLTTLDTLAPGRNVSVERSLRIGDELGGHDVAGHVIGRGEIVALSRDGHDVSVRVRVPEAWMAYVLPKGFIAVDGSSLTVGRTFPDGFTLHLIPETLRLTNFGTRAVGDLVNIELDPRTVAIVDTVERVLAARLGEGALVSPDSSARSQVADVQAHVRIAGHRVALVPKAPFVLTPTDEGVEVVHRGMLARLRVVGDSLRYVVDGGARGLHDLMAAVDTDYAGPFRLETSDFVCAWPDGFRVASPDREGPFLFDLLPEAQGDEAGAGCLVFVAGPYAPELCPSVDALVTAGRALLAREDHETHSVVEVAYEHRGVPQRQWHARFRVGERIFVLTAQGPEDAFDAARAAAQQMVSSLRV